MFDFNLDSRHVWHPYASITCPSKVQMVKRTEGSLMVLEDGRMLVDGMSSWWCAIHGYNHPVLIEAMHQQIDIMPHVMFGGISHQPAVQLTASLLNVLPKGLEKIFFCDSGSVAVEVAVKMAVQYSLGQGNLKTKLMSLQGAYHGDTMMSMSLCDPINSMHALFQDFLPNQIFLPKPCNKKAHLPAYEQQVEQLFKMHAHEVSALIVEPLVQGAGGMNFYLPDCLKIYRHLCDHYGVLLIFDEIATGFGRLGAWFAADLANIQPDIMCLGKAISGGHISLACTVATQEVANGVEAHKRVLMHGPTFMANPLACAVANASIGLMHQYDWKACVKRIESDLKMGLLDCKKYSAVKDVRVKGAIGVVELFDVIDVEKLQDFFVAQGVWLRPFGRLIYVMPSFLINPRQLAVLMEAIVRAVKMLSKFT